jgi:1,4-alpha-glucan branching enzyme
LVFSFHHDSAKSVTLAGDFNEWDATRDHFVKQSNGLWRAEIELPSPGSYQYKFVIDGGVWIDDPSNGMKVADNYNGFNSPLHIAEQISG